MAKNYIHYLENIPKYDMGACFGKCLGGKNGFSFKLHQTSNDDNSTLVDKNQPENESRSFIFRIMRTKSKKHSKFIDQFLYRQETNNYSRLNINSTATPSDIQLQCLDAHSLLLTTTKDKFSVNRPDLYTGLTASPAGSSLDLEWEHEYGNDQTQSWIALPEDVPINDASSEDDCSSNHSEMHKQTKRHKNFQMKISNSNGNYEKIRYSNGNGRKVQRTTHLTSNSSVNSWSHISTPDSMEWDVDPEHPYKSEDSLDHETKELLHEIEQLKNRVLSETGINLKTNDEGEES